MESDENTSPLQTKNGRYVALDSPKHYSMIGAINRESAVLLDFYEYWGRQMVTVQALEGEPFPHTNSWYDTWYSNIRNLHSVFLKDVRLVY